MLQAIEPSQIFYFPDNMLPSIRFTADEIEQNGISQDTWLKACQLFHANGVLMIENAFSPEFMENLHAAFRDRYRDYFADKIFPDARTVGIKRTMITVEVAGPFNSPCLYANPMVFPIIKGILGSQCILNGFGAVVSLPGAPEQPLHRDHGPLFYYDQVDTIMPCFGLTLMTPLVEMNEFTGTTRMYAGSHRLTTEVAEQRPLKIAYQDPHVPVGSCILWDYLLIHHGLANRSDKNRPILYNIYSRQWFRDCHNYGKQRSLTITQEEYRKVPEAYRHLFSWALPGY